MKTDQQRDGLVRLGVKPTLAIYLRQIWSRRDFTITVPMGDLRAQHMNTVLGSIWHLFNPLLLGAVYYLVFGVIFNQRGAVDNFVSFLLIGVLTFHFTSKTMGSGARTVTSNMALIQSLTFPRVVLPIAAVIGEAIAFLPALLVMVLVSMATGETPQLVWLLLIPAMLLNSTFNLGVTFFTARMTFHFRDTLEVLPYVQRLWLYLSGVFYTVDRIPEGRMRDLFELNPLQVFIRINRELIRDGVVSQQAWIYAVVWALVLAVGGFFFFRAKENVYGRGY